MKERIQGLRKERGLTLVDVEKGTGIPKSSLQRLEYDSPDLNAQDIRVGYQDIIASETRCCRRPVGRGYEESNRRGKENFAIFFQPFQVRAILQKTQVSGGGDAFLQDFML